MKSLLFKLGIWGSYLYSYKMCININQLRTFLYTGWLRGNFKHFGNSIIKYKVRLIHGPENITIGDNCILGNNIQLTAWYVQGAKNPNIVIGNNVSIGEDAHITAINSIQIGDNVLMGKKVLITDNSHGRLIESELSIPPAERILYSKGPVVIGNNVWVGEKVTILPNVRIGNGVVIAANSVVTKDVEDNCVVGGIPGKVLRIID